MGIKKEIIVILEEVKKIKEGRKRWDNRASALYKCERKTELKQTLKEKDSCLL